MLRRNMRPANPLTEVTTMRSRPSPTRLSGVPLLAFALGACGGVPASIDDPDQVTGGAEFSEQAATEGETPSLPTAALAAPRPRAPLGGATVTSSRPTLRWLLPPGLAGARVQVCADRDCARVEEDALVRGESARPARALAPGLHYWRVFGVTTKAQGETPSAPVPFYVRRRGTAVDTSWGSVPDFDGDGLADLAVTSQRGSAIPGGPAVEPPRVAVYAGRRFGFPSAPSSTFDATPGGLSSEHWIANTGDVNGDGVADLIVGMPGESGRVELHLGSPDGLAAAPATTLASPNGAPGFAARGAGVGDLDGDGFADVVLVEDDASGQGNRLLVYSGGAAGLATKPSQVLAAVAAHPFGAFAPAGDVNGDGHADLVVARGGAPGRVEIYAGGPGGLSAQPLGTLTSPSSAEIARSTFGLSVVGAGDMNGDGYADVAIAALTGTFASPWRVHVYAGGPDGPVDTPLATIVAPAYAGGRGPELAAARDVNGDGFDDLLVGSPEALIGAPTTKPLLVRAALYFGSLVGPTSVTGQLFTLPALVTDYGGTFGRTVGAVGDLDGDGYADLAIGVAQRVVPSYPGPIAHNFLYVHKGTALGAWAAPTYTLKSERSDTAFGVSVARAH